MRSLATALLLSFSSAVQLHGETLTPFRELHDVVSDPSVTNWRFSCRCQVMTIGTGHTPCLNLIDGDSHLIVYAEDRHTNTSERCHCGDIVLVSGFVRSSTLPLYENTRRVNTVQIEELRVVGHAPFPTPVQAAPAESSALRADQGFVRIGGVISSVVRDSLDSRWNWIVLRNGYGKIRAAVTEHDYPYEKLIRLLDAEVDVIGLTQPFSTWRHFLGRLVLPYGEGGVIVTRPAPDPFLAMAVSDESNPHRQRTTGCVIGFGKGRIYIRDGQRRFLPISLADGQPLPRLGETICVSGFIDPCPVGYRMTEAVYRRENVPVEPLTTPHETDLGSLYPTSSGKDNSDPSYYGRVITLSGRIANSTDGIRTDGKIVLDCDKRMIVVDVLHLLDCLPPTVEYGCRASISGICLADFETDVVDPAFPKFNGFLLLPRTPDDIAITSRPPLWTSARLFAVIVMLILCLVAILVWNRMLKLLSERRGHELSAEQMSRVRADLRVSERTEIAVELHDALSQNLSGVSLQLDAVRRFAGKDQDRMFRHLDFAARTLKSCRSELRNCLWDLRNHALDDMDMNEAIRRSVSPFTGEAKLLIRFNVPRDRISDNTAHVMIRIIRELASNAVTHGAARTVRIAGALDGGRLHVSVKDDGSGFDTANHPGTAEGHFGLDGILERISQLDGTFKITSSPGEGTSAFMTLPA